jgi:hypothetical protein
LARFAATFKTVVTAGCLPFALTIVALRRIRVATFIAKAVWTTAAAAAKAIFIAICAGFIWIAWLTGFAVWLEVTLWTITAIAVSVVSIVPVIPVTIISGRTVLLELGLAYFALPIPIFCVRRTIGAAVFVAVFIFIFIARDHKFSARNESWLHRAQDPKVMLSMLHIVLTQHPIAIALRIAAQLLVLLKDGLSRSTNLQVGTIGLIRPIWIVALWFLTGITSPSALPLNHAKPVFFLANYGPIGAMSGRTSHARGGAILLCTNATKKRYGYVWGPHPRQIFGLHDHRRKLPAQSLTKMDDVSFPNADPPRTASWTTESLARVAPNEKGLHL